MASLTFLTKQQFALIYVPHQEAGFRQLRSACLCPALLWVRLFIISVPHFDLKFKKNNL